MTDLLSIKLISWHVIVSFYLFIAPFECLDCFGLGFREDSALKILRAYDYTILGK